MAGLALASSADAAGYRAPRTPSGAPDLQGLWDSDSLTSLTRPPEFKSLIASDDQATAYERHNNDPDQVAADLKKAFPRASDVGAVYIELESGHFKRLARIGGRARASILIDPPEGQLPLLPAARERLKVRRQQELRNFDSVEMRPLADRCLDSPGPPLVGSSLLQVVQTPDYVAITTDAGMGPRIIRLADKRHGPTEIRPWMGDSVGWWDGDTLVVETTNFNPNTAYWATTGRTPLSPGAKVTERFNRTSATEIIYRFTVEDPSNYTRPWSGVMPFKSDHGRLFSYECHEGNYSLANTLAGARKVEREGGTPEPIDGRDDPPKPVSSSAPTPQGSPPPASPPAP